MQRGSVLSIDVKRRVARIQIEGRGTIDVDVPVDKSYVTAGCLVTVDQESRSLVDVIDIPDNDKDPFDPLAKNRPGVSRGNQSVNWAPSAAVETVGGDYYFQPNKGGFIALMRGFAAFLGGGPMAQIRLFGTRKFAQIIADNFQILGNKVNVSITQSDESSQPKVLLEVGSFRLEADTGGSQLQFQFGGIFRAIISPDRIGVDVRDSKTKDFVPMYDVRPYGEDNTQQVRQMYSTYIAEAAHYMIRAGDALELVAKDLTLTTTNTQINSAMATNMTSKSMDVQVTEKLNFNAGSETHNIGEMGKPGNWQVNNGIMSSMRMNELGNIEIWSLMGVDLNGKGEFAANATQTVIALTIIFSILQAINGVLYAIAPPVADPIQKMIDQGWSAIAKIPNPFVRMGYPTPVRIG